ncbi:core-binding factor subunit beta-like isoform X1 [Apostichopus japonicus]|uniref:core-binding factor subunit beta-like isoform X1 n=1 Tax=Stichopus japonicus TaxID=307972 RepID=UPI003AB136AA
MPRVVPDQRAKFENDELFRKLSRETEIRYTGYRDRSLEERQVRFQASCREGHAEIAFVSTGTNIPLSFLSNAWSENKTIKSVTREFVDFEREVGKVHLKSQLILNGVCITWRGWVDLQRLDGIGYIEYDEERAMIEDVVRKEALEEQSRRLREFEERQRRHREELERAAEAEMEARRRVGRPDTLPCSSGASAVSKAC